MSAYKFRHSICSPSTVKPLMDTLYKSKFRGSVSFSQRIKKINGCFTRRKALGKRHRLFECVRPFLEVTARGADRVLATSKYKRVIRICEERSTYASTHTSSLSKSVFWPYMAVTSTKSPSCSPARQHSCLSAAPRKKRTTIASSILPSIVMVRFFPATGGSGDTEMDLIWTVSVGWPFNYRLGSGCFAREGGRTAILVGEDILGG